MKVEFSVATNKVGSACTEVVEFDEIFETEEEKETFINDAFEEWVWDRIDAWWKEV